MHRLPLAACLLVAQSARAEPSFVMQAGEWEWTTKVDGAPNLQQPTRRICSPKEVVDGSEFDSRAKAIPGSTCTKGAGTVSSNTAIYTEVCIVPAKNMRMQMQTIVTMDEPDTFSVHTAWHTIGGPGPMRDGGITNMAHRLGACRPAGTPGHREGSQ